MRTGSIDGFFARATAVLACGLLLGVIAWVSLVDSSSASPTGASTRSSQYNIDFGAANTAKACVPFTNLCGNYLSEDIGLSTTVRSGKLYGTKASTECKAFKLTYCYIADYKPTSSGASLVVGLKIPELLALPGKLGKVADALCYFDTPCKQALDAFKSVRITYRIIGSLRGGAPACRAQWWFTNTDTHRRDQVPEQPVSCFGHTKFLLW